MARGFHFWRSEKKKQAFHDLGFHGKALRAGDQMQVQTPHCFKERLQSVQTFLG